MAEYEEKPGASAHGEQHIEGRAEVLSDGAVHVDGDGPGVPKGYWYSFRFLGSMTAIVLMANNLFIGYAMGVNGLGPINAEIGPDPNIYLVSLVNTLLQGVGLLFAGSLSDVFGRRWFIIGGQIFAVLGSCIAGTSTSVSMLVGANIFIGFGAAVQVMYPLLVAEIVPNKYRGYGQAGNTLSVFLTLGLGPGFARMFVQYTTLGWRWIYWLNCICAGVSLPLFFICYHPPSFKQLNRGRTLKQALKEIDYLGFFLFCAGVVLVLLSLSWGGTQYPWNSATIIAMLVIGIVTLIGFVFYELYVPRQPIFPMQLFKIRNYSVAVVVGCVGQMAYYAFNVFWPQHITNLGYATDQSTIGWMSTTTGASLAAGEVIMGHFCKKGRYVKWQMTIAMAGTTLFCGLMALADENSPRLGLGISIAVGLFVGWVELVSIVIVGLVIPPEVIGVGQAFFGCARAVSGTLVASIYVATQTNDFAKHLPSQVTDAAVASGFPTSRVSEILAAVAAGTGFSKIQGMTPSITAAVTTAVTRSYSLSYRTTYLTSLVWCGLALAVSFFATNDIDQYFTKFLNKTVDAPHIEALRANPKEVHANTHGAEDRELAEVQMSRNV